MSAISNENKASALYNTLLYAASTMTRNNNKKEATLNDLNTMASRINIYARQGSPQELSTEDKIQAIFEDVANPDNGLQMKREMLAFYTKNIDVIQELGVQASQDLDRVQKDLWELKTRGGNEHIFALTRFFAQEGLNIVRNLPEQISKNLPMILALIRLKEQANALDLQVQHAGQELTVLKEEAKKLAGKMEEPNKELERDGLESQLVLVQKLCANKKLERDALEDQFSSVKTEYDQKFKELPITVSAAITIEDGRILESAQGFSHTDSQLQALRNIQIASMESQAWDLGDLDGECAVKQEKKAAAMCDLDFYDTLDDLELLLDQFESINPSHVVLPDIDLTVAQQQDIAIVADQTHSSPAVKKRLEQKPPMAADLGVLESSWVSAQPNILPQAGFLSSNRHS